MCVERCVFATRCCKTHCNGCMNVAWGLFWGGSWSTKPCFFPCKVAAAGDERYLVCAAVAVALVSSSDRFLLYVLQRLILPRLLAYTILFCSWTSSIVLEWLHQGRDSNLSADFLNFGAGDFPFKIPFQKSCFFDLAPGSGFGAAISAFIMNKTIRKLLCVNNSLCKSFSV